MFKQLLRPVIVDLKQKFNSKIHLHIPTQFKLRTKVAKKISSGMKNR